LGRSQRISEPMIASEYPTIASGLLPSGVLVANPMKYKDREEEGFIIVLCMS
jgi:hypothetical protein